MIFQINQKWLYRILLLILIALLIVFPHYPNGKNGSQKKLIMKDENQVDVVIVDQHQEGKPFPLLTILDSYHIQQINYTIVHGILCYWISNVVYTVESAPIIAYY